MKTYKEKMQNFVNAFNESTKKVKVTLDNDTLQELKDAGYSMCVAKKISEYDYNVVWQSSDKYLNNTIFSWTPQYTIFGSNTFNEGSQVDTSTNEQSILLGQICTLKKSGVITAPVTGGDKFSLNVDNQYGSINFGVSQILSGPDGQSSLPIFSSPDPFLIGTVNLTPVEKIMVWFSKKYKTSCMFVGAQTLSTEVDMTEQSSVVLSYSAKDGWKIVG